MRWWRSSAIGICFYFALSSPSMGEETDLFSLDIDQLQCVSINSASRFDEPLRDAPATLIVLTQNDMQQRGYRELSEMYDDLPGMEMSRSYGDTWYRNQWRGLRKTIGTPYLLMLDGVLLNHLWFNQDEIISSLPLSVVDRVEVVYGPASVVYGANAFVGVINVITKRDPGTQNQSATIRYLSGSFDRQIVDAHFLQRLGDLTISLAAKHDEGDLDQQINNRYEYLKDDYFSNRQLWGPFVDFSHYGHYNSPYANDGIDLRLYYQQFEFAAQYFRLNTGFGNVYPADRILNYSRWKEPETSIYTRYTASLAENVSSSTLLRYRRSGVDPSSTTLEGYNVDDTFGARRVVDFSYWRSDSDSVAFHEDLTWLPNEQWAIASGLRFERKHLQRAYDINWGSSVEIDPCDQSNETFPFCLNALSDYDWPQPVENETILNNHITTYDRSLYALARWKLGGDHWQGHQLALHFGGRYDHNSEVGSAPTKRLGAVYGYQNWTLKLLYGESFNEPTGRELFGGWQGSGSSPTLEPETAKTWEFSASYQTSNWQVVADIFDLHSDKDIITFAGGARNLGQRDVHGIDLHGNWQRNFSASQLKLWFYYSHLLRADESLPYFVDSQCTDVSHCEVAFDNEHIGDNANHKWWWGATWSWRSQWSMNLRARHIGARDTVNTNPLQQVSAFTVWDLNVVWRNAVQKGFDFSFSVNNLFDRAYFHPGLREANAGSTPGYFDSHGQWQGSAGWYNSLLPQPGRALYLSLAWRY